LTVCLARLLVVLQLTPDWEDRVAGTPMPEKNGPGRDRRCRPTILRLRRYAERSSLAISPRCSGTRCDPKARPSNRADRGAAFVSRALGGDVAGGYRIDVGLALVVQTQIGIERRSETKLFLNMRNQMPSILNEALEWLDRAEQAREVRRQRMRLFQ
jgi:hypothetical protein